MGGNALDRTRLTGRLARINSLIPFGFALLRSIPHLFDTERYVLEMFAPELCLKSRPLAAAPQSPCERVRINNC
jgi:hypothetical protein